jgi:hypothetical protein
MSESIVNGNSAGHLKYNINTNITFISAFQTGESARHVLVVQAYESNKTVREMLLWTASLTVTWLRASYVHG